MRTHNYAKILAAIKKRQDLEQQVQVIEGKYRPRIDRLVAAMNKRSSKKMIKIRTLSTDIKCRRFALSGGDLARLRRLFPYVKDL